MSAGGDEEEEEARFSFLLCQLCSKDRLERDAGEEALAHFFHSPCSSFVSPRRQIAQLLLVESAPWHEYYGALRAFKALLEVEDDEEWSVGQLAEQCADRVLDLLAEEEERVRAAACALLVPLVNKTAAGGVLALRLLDRCLLHLHTQLDQAHSQDERGRGGGVGKLESDLGALVALVGLCSAEAKAERLESLLEAVETGARSSGLFVRLAAYRLLAALLLPPSSASASASATPLDGHRLERLVAALHLGLLDRWPPARQVATAAVGELSVARPLDETTEELYGSQLVPALCLNRHYSADGSGVERAAGESWQRLTNGRGAVLVTRHVSDVLNCYVNEALNGEPAGREAACRALGELLSRFDGQLPSLNGLLEAANACARHQVRQVREASSTCLRALAVRREGPPQLTETAVSMLVELLVDVVDEVRLAAVDALTKACVERGAGDEQLKTTVCHAILSNLRGAAHPEAEPLLSAGVVKAAEQQQQLHIDSFQVGRIGHMSCALISRQKCSTNSTSSSQLLAASADGSFRFFVSVLDKAELADWHKHLVLNLAIFEPIFDICRLDEQFCRLFVEKLPTIGKALERRTLKQLLNDLLSTILSAFDMGYAEEAEGCLLFLARLVGPNILRGRVDMLSHGNRYTALLDKLLLPLQSDS